MMGSVLRRNDAREYPMILQLSLLRSAGCALLCLAISASAQTTAPAVEHPRQPSRCSTALEDRNLANFRAYLAALTSGDIATAVGYYAPGAAVVAHGSVPFAGTFTVADGAWGAVQQQYWDFSNIDATEQPVLYADCDKVILNGPFKRTARATGRTVSTRVIEYFTFNNEGKILRDDFYLTDTAAVNAVLTSP
jgi:ketosteroid isomerase-like protein